MHDGYALRYRASKSDCDVCAFKMRCCPSTPMRYVPRDLHEDARDAARALAKTEAFERSRRSRKRVEMLFAHLKRILRLGRLRLRGPRGAQDEFTLAAIAQNLRRLAKLVARPPPVVDLVSRDGASANGTPKSRQTPKPAAVSKGPSRRRTGEVADFRNKIYHLRTFAASRRTNVQGHVGQFQARQSGRRWPATGRMDNACDQMSDARDHKTDQAYGSKQNQGPK